MWIPQTTKGMPDIPLLSPWDSGLDDVRGYNPGLISQNGEPPYVAGRIEVVAHWLKDAPLRPAPLRSPGKPANCFAVEAFCDELAAADTYEVSAYKRIAVRLKSGLEAFVYVAA